MKPKESRMTFLSALILKCENPEEIALWYRETMEIPMEKRGDGFSCLLGQTHFAIHPLLPGQRPTRDVEIGLYVADLDDRVRKLESRNIELVDPIREHPWARAAQIRDPSGNLIYLMQLPESSLELLFR